VLAPNKVARRSRRPPARPTRHAIFTIDGWPKTICYRVGGGRCSKRALTIMESVVCRPPRIRSSGAPARPPPPPVHSRRGCARPADEWKRTEPSGSGARARKDARQDSGFKFGPLAGQSGPLWPARRPASQPATGPANSGRANDSRSSQASNNLMVPRPSLALIVARKADLARLQRQWQWQWRRQRQRQRIGRLAGGRRAHLAPARRPPATQIKARAKPSWAPI